MLHVLEPLIQMVSRLPGLGPRSARRIVLYLLKHKVDVLTPLLDSFEQVMKRLQICNKCFYLDVQNPCSICTDEKRDKKVLCIVEDIIDVWAIEKTRNFKGQYHILGGVLSAVEGKGPDELNFSSLKNRVQKDNYEEVIIALNSNVDGQTTMYYLMDQLKDLDVKISKPALGIPLGGELDYIDEGTINLAFSNRLKCNSEF